MLSKEFLGTLLNKNINKYDIKFDVVEYSKSDFKKMSYYVSVNELFFLALDYSKNKHYIVTPHYSFVNNAAECEIFDLNDNKTAIFSVTDKTIQVATLKAVHKIFKNEIKTKSLF